jgi:hypothetical protein
MPIAGSIESKIANWPAVRPPIMIDEINRRRAPMRHRAADAARQEALEVVVRRVQRVVVDGAFDGHISKRVSAAKLQPGRRSPVILSESFCALRCFLSLRLSDF